MCTLIVLRQVVPDQALVVASNRDEYLARPAAPPHVTDMQCGEPFVAPQDLEAGGTWIGVNAAGLFIGLTNRADTAGAWGAAQQPHIYRSRGLLVRDLLLMSDVTAVRERLAHVRLSDACESRAPMDRGSDAYRPFNLIAIDDTEGLRVTHTNEGSPALTSLDRGVHVLCNREPSEEQCSKVEWIRRALAGADWSGPLSAVLGQLRAILSAHPFEASSTENPCIHRHDYGTRSSTLFTRTKAGWQGWHADGPPCRTPYESYTPMLERLQSSGVRI